MRARTATRRCIPALSPEHHEERIVRYIEEYRSYLKTWVLYAAGTATHEQVQERLARYLTAYRAYLGSEMLAFAVAARAAPDAVALKQIERTLDAHIELTRYDLERLARLFMAEMAEPVQEQEKESPPWGPAKPGRHAEFLAIHPEAKVWLDVGLKPHAALGLCKAGLLSLEHLAGKSRDDLGEILGIGEKALRVIEAALGRSLPSRISYWQERGVPPAARQVFHQEGIETVEQLQEIRRDQALGWKGMGPALLARVEEALGIRLRSPLSYWQEQGLRSRTARSLNAAGLRTLDELAAVSPSDLAGFLNPVEVATIDVVLREARAKGKLGP